MYSFKNLISTIMIMMIPCMVMASSSAKIAACIAFRALNTDQHRPKITRCQANIQLLQQAITASMPNISSIKQIVHKNQNVKNKDHYQTHQLITRDQAYLAIEQTILTIYEGANTKTPLENLEQIQSYSQYLDSHKDKDVIEAINFASENKDKTNMFFDLPFWYDAWYNKGFKNFPVPKKIRDIPYSKMIPKIINLSTQL